MTLSGSLSNAINDYLKEERMSDAYRRLAKAIVDSKGNTDATTRLHKDIAKSLSTFGGILFCSTCDKVNELGDIAVHLANGWPMHCGYTMTWVTDDQMKQLLSEIDFVDKKIEAKLSVVDD